MIKNMRIPRYKTTIPDSEISDGTTPVFADSEARVDRFSQKRNFISDRADKNLYFPFLTFGRGHSDASRRFVTWVIKIYNADKGIEYIESKNSYSTSYILDSDAWSRTFGCFTPTRNVCHRNL